MTERGTALVLLTCALQLGCTFVTSCPTADPNPPNTGGTNGMGGSNGGGGGGKANTGGERPIVGEWENVTSNLEGLESECGNLTSLFARPGQDMLIAGIALQGLWASTNGGGDWFQLGQGAGSDQIVHRPTSIVFDPEDSATWWEAGIYHPEAPGVHVTHDDGETFTALEGITHCDAVGVDFTDPDRLTLLAGSHETSQTLYRSVDAGLNWENIGTGLPGGTDCTRPYVLDSETYLVGCSGYHGAEEAGPIAIFRTTDGGANWTQVSDVGGGLPVRASDGTLYAVGSPNAPGVLTRSEDDGETWSEALGAARITNSPIVELPNGLLGALNERRLVVSEDRGETWVTISPDLEFRLDGFTYSAEQRAFFAWHATCGFDGPVPVPSDAVVKFAFDYEDF
ncbi:MAG TPA: sialidase family protein [Polyangiaceae bacterium]|nr:sialidase family protein [Polyangiaceae bacterium]